MLFQGGKLNQSNTKPVEKRAQGLDPVAKFLNLCEVPTVCRRQFNCYNLAYLSDLKD